MNSAMPSPAVWNEPNVNRKGSMTAEELNSSSHQKHFHTVVSKPTQITVTPMSFLIMDAPRQSNLHLYIRECRKHGVSDIVRVCEPTYQGDIDLRNAGIELHEMAYNDGTSPSREILERWLDLVHDRFYKKKKPLPDKSNGNGSGSSVPSTRSSNDKAATTPVNGSFPPTTIAVHCIAGLGRAPVLVAIALIEFAGMDPVDAVSLIRKHRRGAINEKQLQYLEGYKKFYAKKLSGGKEALCACVVM